MKIITDVEAAYIAGILDGEGCIAIHKKAVRKQHHNPTFLVHMDITNTSRDLLGWVRLTTGLGKILDKPRTKGWKACYKLFFIADEIKPLLERVLPYMLVRRKQAELVLEFIGTIKYHGPAHPTTVDEYIQKELIFEEIEELNRRGDGSD